ncbi:MAG TPA: alanine--glyoxylate aminotransferase family protein, partial [Kofleriaceae bacterium]|nr:alanine--glyoxylate aminotransferase family protein [Kofleriaceae bacterium]
PGPVNTTMGVKSALIHHDVCHRDSNFSELLVSLSGKLRRIFRGSPEHSVCVITGSGTAAMECALASTVPRDRKILVIDNGAFGERLYEISRLHEMEVVHLRYAWGDQVDPADVQRAFEENPDIAVVAMTHHETSVGLLNPIGAVGALCRRYDALFLVDAVSSLGAEDIDVVRDQVDICWASANKCLHAISGVGILCVSPRVWPKIELVKPRTYYLDLKRYRKYIDELAQTPFTPAVSNYFALDQACSEFLADGHARRFAMYRERNQRLRSGLAALGMASFTRTGRESHSVLTCCVPAGIAFEDLYERLKRRGYIVYACKDVLADRFMQVANMGDLALDRIDAFLVAVREVIAELRREPVHHDAAAAGARVRATA